MNSYSSVDGNKPRSLSYSGMLTFSAVFTPLLIEIFLNFRIIYIIVFLNSDSMYFKER
jgi:hypothetical protein